jgi:hypothetical protein
MFYLPEFAFLHASALVMALVLALFAWKRPRVGRLLYLLLFVWAAAVNWTTALTTPSVYLEYGPLALLDLYREIIHGIFARFAAAFVGAIATCQGLIALGFVFGGLGARPSGARYATNGETGVGAMAVHRMEASRAWGMAKSAPTPGSERPSRAESSISIGVRYARWLGLDRADGEARPSAWRRSLPATLPAAALILPPSSWTCVTGNATSCRPVPRKPPAPTIR